MLAASPVLRGVVAAVALGIACLTTITVLVVLLRLSPRELLLWLGQRWGIIEVVLLIGAAVVVWRAPFTLVTIAVIYVLSIGVFAASIIKFGVWGFVVFAVYGFILSKCIEYFESPADDP